MVTIDMLSTMLNASHNPLYQSPQEPYKAEMKGCGISQRQLERFLRKYNKLNVFKNNDIDVSMGYFRRNSLLAIRDRDMKNNKKKNWESK